MHLETFSFSFVNTTLTTNAQIVASDPRSFNQSFHTIINSKVTSDNRLYRRENGEIILLSKTSAEVIGEKILGPVVMKVYSLYKSNIGQAVRNCISSLIFSMYSQARQTCTRIDRALSFPVADASPITKNISPQIKDAIEKLKDVSESLFNAVIENKVSQETAEVKNIRIILAFTKSSEFSTADLVEAGWENNLIDKINSIVRLKAKNERYLEKLQTQKRISSLNFDINGIKAALDQAILNAEAKEKTLQEIGKEFDEKTAEMNQHITKWNEANAKKQPIVNELWKSIAKLTLKRNPQEKEKFDNWARGKLAEVRHYDEILKTYDDLEKKAKASIELLKKLAIETDDQKIEFLVKVDVLKDDLNQKNEILKALQKTHDEL